MPRLSSALNFILTVTDLVNEFGGDLTSRSLSLLSYSTAHIAVRPTYPALMLYNSTGAADMSVLNRMAVIATADEMDSSAFFVALPDDKDTSSVLVARSAERDLVSELVQQKKGAEGVLTGFPAVANDGILSGAFNFALDDLLPSLPDNAAGAIIGNVTATWLTVDPVLATPETIEAYNRLLAIWQATYGVTHIVDTMPSKREAEEADFRPPHHRHPHQPHNTNGTNAPNTTNTTTQGHHFDFDPAFARLLLELGIAKGELDALEDVTLHHILHEMIRHLAEERKNATFTETHRDEEGDGKGKGKIKRWDGDPIGYAENFWNGKCLFCLW